MWVTLKFAIRGSQSFRRKTAARGSTRRRIAEIIAIFITLNTQLCHLCQQVNLLTYYSNVCAKGSPANCQIQLSEMFKINPFKREACLRLTQNDISIQEREACLRLTQNDISIHEVRIEWDALLLTCDPESDLFTSDTRHKVVDSKRCPHSGSCVGDKCGSINASSIIPELEVGNRYPGNTACVEFCGGPGCDCFYLSSGCLFYRIYLQSINNNTFEIFHCNRWAESARIKVNHFNSIQKKSGTVTKLLQPNVLIVWNIFTITLTSIGIPPLPLRNTQFISSGTKIALWKTAHVLGGGRRNPGVPCQRATEKSDNGKESLQHHTERFILLQSILNLKRQQDPAIPASINIEGGNIRETVTKHLKKLEENIGDMQYELKQTESLVNTERLCMDEIKKLVKTMDQKVRSIVPSSHHSTPAVMSPRQGLETDKGNGLDDKPKIAGETGPTLIKGKERKRPISRNPFPKRKALNAEDPPPQTKPLTDEEYMDWLIEQSNNYDDDAELSSDESAPPKQTRLEENIPDSAQRPPLDETAAQGPCRP
ncbi:unnamed protein product [Heligmosomoides polygyrus]|uniref:Phlebovirus glycoprotein G2 fusion domain-containing protein n=1 Tax=Heligmosomoides polygyrus TaxID=6339 RepID=A0A3P8ATY7_HELPZ|nr:unnamed protein product [Heligmosomoides polygyrus]